MMTVNVNDDRRSGMKLWKRGGLNLCRSTGGVQGHCCRSGGIMIPHNTLFTNHAHDIIMKVPCFIRFKI